ncbi:MAG: hypothetical protein ACR2M4_03175 [Actinomycetota bacterium]
MASAGVGTSVEGPIAVPPRFSLLSSAQVIEDNDERWAASVTFDPESCGGDVFVVPICPPGGTEKALGSNPGDISADGFGIVAADSCSPYSQREYAARARRKLLACQSKQIEKEFWNGTIAPTNPHLIGTASLDFGFGHTPLEALALIEKELGICGCGRGMIHMSPKMATLLCTNGNIHQEGDHLETCLGTIVVAGTGYPGTNPAGTLASGSEYMYGTGMVQVRLGRVTVVPGNMGEALDRATNLVTFYAERPAMVLFDQPCCHLAVGGTLQDTPSGT